MVTRADPDPKLYLQVRFKPGAETVLPGEIDFLETFLDELIREMMLEEEVADAG